MDKRRFNITGKIIPELHYYVDLTPQLKKLMALADEGTYFVINRPRQFGKTTVLDFFARRLQASKDYVPALISFESFTQLFDITEAEFYANVAKRIFEELKPVTDGLTDIKINDFDITSRNDFFEWLRETCRHLRKKLVLLIDETDAVPETVVIGFLAGLREMFLQRDRKPAAYAVCLAGVHDIKNLKARYRKETRSLGSASPFNIAIDYELPPFNLKNIRQYFLQHTKETGQTFDEQVFARVHHVTNGHPWLVSVLAKTMVEGLVPHRRRRIQLDHTEAAIQKLFASRNSNFDNLFNNAHNPRLLPIVLDLLTGKRHQYDIQSDDFNLGIMHGVFARKDRQL
ncbi:MAG: AAA-like domain-containing protein, partial [bacterium]